MADVQWTYGEVKVENSTATPQWSYGEIYKYQELPAVTGALITNPGMEGGVDKWFDGGLR